MGWGSTNTFQIVVLIFCFFSCRKPSGNIQETCTYRKLAGNMQETHKKLPGHMQATCREHAENLQETYRKPVGNIHETYWEHSGNM